MAESVVVKVVDRNGADLGDLSLDGLVYNQPVAPGLLHQVVVWQLAKRRQGTHQAKTKSEVSRSKAKPWKQKGTGRARAGSKCSPLWVGGGVSHGPRPRSYETSLTKKVRRRALQGALSARIIENAVRVVDSFGELSGKTSEVVPLLSSLSSYRRSVLVVSARPNEMLRRACRNIPGTIVLPVEGLNVYDLLKSREIIVEKGGLELIAARIQGAKLGEVCRG